MSQKSFQKTTFEQARSTQGTLPRILQAAPSSHDQALSAAMKAPAEMTSIQKAQQRYAIDQNWVRYTEMNAQLETAKRELCEIPTREENAQLRNLNSKPRGGAAVNPLSEHNYSKPAAAPSTNPMLQQMDQPSLQNLNRGHPDCVLGAPMNQRQPSLAQACIIPIPRQSHEPPHRLIKRQAAQLLQQPKFQASNRNEATPEAHVGHPSYPAMVVPNPYENGEEMVDENRPPVGNQENGLVMEQVTESIRQPQYIDPANYDSESFASIIDEMAKVDFPENSVLEEGLPQDADTSDDPLNISTDFSLSEYLNLGS